jgi:tetratricopeptide (TPR) repeat protein
MSGGRTKETSKFLSSEKETQMRIYKFALLIAFAIAPALFFEVAADADLVFAQTNPREQAQTAFTLEQEGRFDEVIAILAPMVAGNQLTRAGLGNASIMLGVAYEGVGNLAEAQHAYDRALLLFEHDPQHSSEYAAALDNYGRLYTELNQLDAAESLWRQALQLRRQNREHAPAVRSLIDLAGLALARNNVPQAREYLKDASQEMKLTHELVDDDVAIFFETRGWLTLSEGHAHAAIAEYQRALALCRRAHGDDHWLVGWEHMLVGKAYAQAGDLQHAESNMLQGLAILEHALGRKNPKYFVSEIAYAQLLDQAGSHEQAASLKSEAEQASKQFYGSQCSGCTINIAAFR